MEAITAGLKSSQSDNDNEGSEDEDSDSASSADEPSPKKKKPLPPPSKKKKPKTSSSDSESKPKPKESDSDSDSKEKGKPPSSGSESEMDDEALARKLQEEERLPRRRAAAMKVAPKKRNTKKQDPDKPKVKRDNMYSKNCVLSEPLAEVVGAKEMPRSGVVKRIWEVARERNLFDPKNKRYVICDEQLQKIFGNHKRVLLFGMMKYLKSHITDAYRL